MINVTRLQTAHEMWTSLEAVHESKGQQYAMAISRTLYHTGAEEGDDLVEHLNKLKESWEKLNILNNRNFRITDTQFKSLIASSLPQSWDFFTDPYVQDRGDTASKDPKTMIPSQEFIGIIKEEFLRRKNRSETTASHHSYQTTSQSNHKPLINRLKDPNQTQVDNSLHCRNCNLTGHCTDNCKWLGQVRCRKCNWFGHMAKDCRRKGKGKRKAADTSQEKGKKKQKEQTNEAHNDDSSNEGSSSAQRSIAYNNQELTFIVDESTAEDCTLDTYTSDDVMRIDSDLSSYDWLGDTATTSHITNSKQLFTTFQPIEKTAFSGVGNITTLAEGRGTVELESNVNGQTYIFKLKDVLYIPSNNQNLISLGRWDNSGGHYIGGGGTIILVAKNGEQVAKGQKISNNLYKMDIYPRRTQVRSRETPQTFVTEEPAQCWETWHRRLGHMGYTTLQRMLDNDLVYGFQVDKNSPQPDCRACTEAKQTIKPFGETTKRITKPGELTHTDLWGPYSVTSIHGNLYYASFVDDSTKLGRVEFLKGKNQATETVKNHFTNLKTQGRNPRALRVDNGKEFYNKELIDWCKQQGIEIQFTAPYSPSQNGVAEHLNHTLLELARAMLIARDLLIFLWEYAIAYAMYLRNRVYHRSLDKTPYELWFQNKPDISHLREFGAPVWILL